MCHSVRVQVFFYIRKHRFQKQFRIDVGSTRPLCVGACVRPAMYTDQSQGSLSQARGLSSLSSCWRVCVCCSLLCVDCQLEVMHVMAFSLVSWLFDWSPRQGPGVCGLCVSRLHRARVVSRGLGRRVVSLILFCRRVPCLLFLVCLPFSPYPIWLAKVPLGSVVFLSPSPSLLVVVRCCISPLSRCAAHPAFVGR